MSKKVVLKALEEIALENIKAFFDKLPYKSADDQEAIIKVLVDAYNLGCSARCNEHDQIFYISDREAFEKELHNASDEIFNQLCVLRSESVDYAWYDKDGNLTDIDIVCVVEAVETDFDTIFRDMMTEPKMYGRFWNWCFPDNLFQDSFDSLKD